MKKQSQPGEKKRLSIIIRPKSSWFDLHLSDVWHYRDLVFMFVRRDFVSVYKQTVLGPLWFIIQPIITTIVFTIIFNRVAKISTDGIPPEIFYLSGLVIWNYFSTCLNNTANTFTANADLFGKVYFPRLIVPLSSVITAFISFCIQFGILVVLIVYYRLVFRTNIHFNSIIFLLPLLVVIVAVLALGLGIIISSLTTKYRDLFFLVTFGIQLLMYATPVIYPLSLASSKYKPLILANPITPLIETFRFSLLGVGEFSLWHLLYSIVFTVVTLFIGIVIFNRVEKNFMDVV